MYLFLHMYIISSVSSLVSKQIRNKSFIIRKMNANSATLADPVESMVVKNYNEVLRRMNDVVVERGSSCIRLVAVSKTKSNNDIMELYNSGVRIFGENYVQELIEKSASLPPDISWHFIGHLQSRNVKSLIQKCPNLSVMETVDSEKLASKLQAALASLKVPKVLDIFIQVDTSGEDTKSGIDTSEVIPMLEHLRRNCPNLVLKGFMTIGAPGDLSCFDKLVACREMVAAHLGTRADDFELSMGMSGDFEEAIRRGATSVRVGSVIFGERDYSK